jgi:hypothetical protein
VEPVTVDNAMYLAAFITHAMKQKADGIGGPTQLLQFRVDHPHWFAPKDTDIVKIEKGGFINGQFRFADLETNVRHFFWSRLPHEFVPVDSKGRPKKPDPRIRHKRHPKSISKKSRK